MGSPRTDSIRSSRDKTAQKEPKSFGLQQKCCLLKLKLRINWSRSRETGYKGYQHLGKATEERLNRKKRVSLVPSGWLHSRRTAMFEIMRGLQKNRRWFPEDHKELSRKTHTKPLSASQETCALLSQHPAQSTEPGSRARPEEPSQPIPCSQMHRMTHSRTGWLQPRRGLEQQPL